MALWFRNARRREGLAGRMPPGGALIPVRIAKKSPEALDICSFDLVAADGGALPAFGAGAHVDVHIRDGLVRQYSLCNPPWEHARYQIAVLRDANTRGGSRAMHDEVKEGSIVHISAARNHFPLAENAQRTLLFAGGIGITPILCMAEQLASMNAEFELHYCARSRDRAAFRNRIARSPFANRVVFHFDDGPAVQRLSLAPLLASRLAGTHLYVCGPGPFINWITSTAAAEGWHSAQVHVEFFTPAPELAAGTDSFEVQIASTGRSYRIPPDKTILQVLTDHGIDVASSCEQGICGTCMTRVLEGEPEHRDLYLTDQERARNDWMMLCCSRSRSARLVLDL